VVFAKNACVADNPPPRPGQPLLAVGPSGFDREERSNGSCLPLKGGVLLLRGRAWCSMGGGVVRRWEGVVLLRGEALFRRANFLRRDSRDSSSPESLLIVRRPNRPYSESP
jgi:hypothetical protein